MLRRLGKDIHSPKYVCPTDLHREHDLRQNELRRQREKEEKEKKRKKAMEDENVSTNSNQNSSVSVHGRHNPSPRFGERSGTFG
ncbi:PcfJ domain-containing protein [Prevotella intermedia]|uniref:PcfJ domain-containing protein n=1 Tax=Prevotella intermedia TaxID=28131 RepID=UPI0020A509E0|nr:PcfJ domain-containing protein [Prevotella intermedia]